MANPLGNAVLYTLKAPVEESTDDFQVYHSLDRRQAILLRIPLYLHCRTGRRTNRDSSMQGT